MCKRHYYIAVKNKFNAWATIYCGTNLPKMSKAFCKLEKQMEGYGFKFKLDIDENYDSDCGAFKTYEQVFGEPSQVGPTLAFDNVLCDIRKEFGEEAD